MKDQTPPWCEAEEKKGREGADRGQGPSEAASGLAALTFWRSLVTVLSPPCVLVAVTVEFPFSFSFLFVFLQPHLQHMEVPRLGVESELQLLTYTTATATRDP